MSATEKARLEAELSTLESEWREEEKRFLVRGKDGKLEEPKPVNVVAAIGMMIGSVIVMAFLSATPLPIYITYLGLIPFGLGTYQLLAGSSKAEQRERFRTAYESKRAALMRKLSECE